MAIRPDQGPRFLCTSVEMHLDDRVPDVGSKSLGLGWLLKPRDDVPGQVCDECRQVVVFQGVGPFAYCSVPEFCTASRWLYCDAAGMQLALLTVESRQIGKLGQASCEARADPMGEHSGILQQRQGQMESIGI